MQKAQNSAKFSPAIDCMTVCKTYRGQQRTLVADQQSSQLTAALPVSVRCCSDREGPRKHVVRDGCGGGGGGGGGDGDGWVFGGVNRDRDDDVENRGGG